MNRVFAEKFEIFKNPLSLSLMASWYMCCEFGGNQSSRLPSSPAYKHSEIHTFCQNRFLNNKTDIYTKISSLFF